MSFFHLQEPVHTKLSVHKITNLKLFFVCTVMLVVTKIVFACFNKTGKNRKIKKT